MININEVEKILLKIKKWKSISIISSQQNEDQYTIILREEKANASGKYARRIIISLSKNIVSYSIDSFEIRTNGDLTEQYIPLFNTKVIGNMEVNNVIADLKAIINGKDESIFGAKSSFDLKI